MKKLISFAVVILLAVSICLAAFGTKDKVSASTMTERAFKYEIQTWLPLVQFEKYRGLFMDH